MAMNGVDIIILADISPLKKKGSYKSISRLPQHATDVRGTHELFEYNLFNAHTNHRSNFP